MSLKHKLLSGAMILGVSSLISRLLGLLRDRLFSTTFGALQGSGVHDLDSYYAAFRLPDMLFNLLIYGAIASAFVPIFTSYIKKNKTEEGWQFTSAALTILIAILIIVSVLAFIFAPWIVKVFVPGFSAEKLSLTINLTRMMLLSPLFFGLASVFQSVQNSFKVYTAIALSPILYNIGIIAGTYFGAEKFGVYAVALGVVFGAFMYMAIYLPSLIKLGFRYKFNMDFHRSDIKEMARLLIPRVIGVSVSQINLVVSTLIGSMLVTGSIAILNYAVNLNSLPIGVVGLSISIVAFGTFAELAAMEDHQGLFHTFKENFYKIAYLIIPAAIGMIMLKTEIVQIILKGGKFGVEDMNITAQALGILTIGLIAQSLIPLFTKAFYAYKNTKTPVSISIVAIAINIFLSILLAKIFNFGVYGLAIATTTAGFIHWILLQIYLQKLLPYKEGSIIDWSKIFKILICSGAMAVIVYFSKNTVQNFMGQSFMSALAQVAVCAVLGLAVYFGGMKLLKYKN